MNEVDRAMKTFLKIWASFLLVVAIGCYCIGVFGGSFNKMLGDFPYGTSTEAIVLHIASCGCLLLSISCWIVYGTIRDIEDKI